MSSKRKAASGLAAVAVDDGDAHAAKRRKLPVSTAIVDSVLCHSVTVGGLVVELRKFIKQRRHLDWIGPMA